VLPGRDRRVQASPLTDRHRIAQVTQNAGTSLREIAEETSLGLRTVRTIVSQGNGTDRTTNSRRMRLNLPPPAPPPKHRYKNNLGKATRAALPKRATAHLEEGRELLKQAKGLARTRAGS
jgi:hypothetical protein